MIDLSKLFDSYSRQARLFPGLLTLFPIILTAIAWFPRLVTSSWDATLVTVGTSCGLMYGLMVLSRSRGKKVEKRLLAEWGGWADHDLATASRRASSAAGVGPLSRVLRKERGGVRRAKRRTGGRRSQGC
jgi:hypothetical protein